MINKWPVIIISNYRTGSSELALRIANQYSAIPLIEPIHHKDILSNLEKMYSSGNMKFVVKYHIDQIEQLDIQKKLLEIDSYKIKITRKDKVSQIASYYISSIRNVWKQDTKTIESYEISLNIKKLNEAIKIILENDRLLDLSTILFDKEIQYEDIFVDNAQEIQHNYKTTPPTNIKILKSFIEFKLNNFT